jgi:hypothetical protein
VHYKIKQYDLPGLETCNGTDMLPAQKETKRTYA